MFYSQGGRQESGVSPQKLAAGCLTRHRNDCVFPGAVLMEKGLFVCPGFIQGLCTMMETDFIEMPEVPNALPSQSSEAALWEGL